MKQWKTIEKRNTLRAIEDCFYTLAEVDFMAVEVVILEQGKYIA